MPANLVRMGMQDLLDSQDQQDSQGFPVPLEAPVNKDQQVLLVIRDHLDQMDNVDLMV